jgi:GT2 family glycosyltransferase
LITVSIVSHGQSHLLKKVVGQLANIRKVKKIIITINIPEKTEFLKNNKIFFIKNNNPKGFGENHNIAFKYCKTDYFCVLNPDIKLIKNPFNELLKFISNSSPLVSAIIVNKKYEIEDNARYFPTPISILKKLFFDHKGIYKSKNNLSGDKIFPEWIAGMFMLFTKKIYKRLNGFDENFFLYYEDVDIWCRLKKLKKKILVIKNIRIIHDARRSSRKNLKYFLIHLYSMIFFFYKHLGRYTKNDK